LTTKTPRCHYCDRVVGRKSCRQEDGGWYCQQRGLLVGVGVEILVPEQTPEPWKNDPALLAATEAEEAAQRAYDDADIAWMRALRKLSEHRIRTADELQYTPALGWDFKATNRGKQKLKDAETITRQKRDDAGEALQAARVNYSAALAAAPRDYRTKAALLPSAYGTPCPKCGKPLLQDDDLELGRSRPLAIDPHSRPDRIQHVNYNRTTATAHQSA
jgi:hypothetical protein